MYKIVVKTGWPVATFKTDDIYRAISIADSMLNLMINDEKFETEVIITKEETTDAETV